MLYSLYVNVYNLFMVWAYILTKEVRCIAWVSIVQATATLSIIGVVYILRYMFSISRLAYVGPEFTAPHWNIYFIREFKATEGEILI